ncbi:MAG: hypothetical protein OXR62_08370 [Ahrensia sp.]|nr:hypothetical protein [Ahrensia sp.]
MDKYSKSVTLHDLGLLAGTLRKNVQAGHTNIPAPLLHQLGGSLEAFERDLVEYGQIITLAPDEHTPETTAITLLPPNHPGSAGPRDPNACPVCRRKW